MFRPTITRAAAIAMAVLLAGCGTTTEPTGGPADSAAVATVAPRQTPASTPTPTQTSMPKAPPLPSPQPVSLLWEAHGPVTDKTSTGAIAVNPVDGTVWVGVPFENLYWIFDADGDYLESWGAAGTGPGQFDFSDHAPNPDGFSAIAFAPDGSFFVGDIGNHRVQHFDADRAYLGEWGQFGTSDGSFVGIISIATDGSTVYVGDSERPDIQAFDVDGTYLRSIEGGFVTVAVDGQGNVHASYPEENYLTGAPQQLAIFDRAGNELSRTDLGVSPRQREVPSVAADEAGNTYLPTINHGYPWAPRGVIQIGPDGQVIRVFEGGGESVGVSSSGDVLYLGKGIQLDSAQWTFIRAYALPGL